jgi:FixJ family two-component response regulator
MITVVDDDPSVRKALSRLIAASGYDAAMYESAEAFLEAGVAAQTECLVLDVHLPGMSGLDLQAELAKSGVNCPIVFITAFDAERPRRQALEAGAAGFLRKPLDSEHLLEAIEAALGGD